jgi:hypothetical protein
MRVPTVRRVVSEARVVVRIILGSREAWRPVRAHTVDHDPLTDIERSRLEHIAHDVAPTHGSPEAPPHA